jgi:hypothetical protein
MKGVPNRQKTVVRPRETMQKYLLQQKNVRSGILSNRQHLNGSKSSGSKKKG